MNRRRFTIGTSIVVGIPALLSSGEPLAAFDREVRRLLVHSEDAIAIGLRYLHQRPVMASHVALLNDVTMGRPWRNGPFARHLHEWLTRDFRDGRVVVIDGWVLARTEASLCAWLALG